MRLSNDPKDKPWLPIMICVRCGYATTATNICRECPKAPATAAMNPEMVIGGLPCDYCGVPHWTTWEGKRVPAKHEASQMVYSGKVERWAQTEYAITWVPRGHFKPILRKHISRKYVRNYKPENDDEKSKLWVGWGVVFDR